MFVVAWLNLAVQPCVMAMESTPEPVVASAQSMHADHASHAPDHDCDHCPPALTDRANACASAVTSDCGSIVDYNYDGRNGQAELKNTPFYLAVADIAIPADFIDSNSSPPPPEYAAFNYPGEPPLNLRFCVFLK